MSDYLVRSTRLMIPTGTIVAFGFLYLTLEIFQVNCLHETGKYIMQDFSSRIFIGVKAFNLCPWQVFNIQPPANPMFETRGELKFKYTFSLCFRYYERSSLLAKYGNVHIFAFLLVHCIQDFQTWKLWLELAWKLCTRSHLISKACLFEPAPRGFSGVWNDLEPLK